MSLKRRYVIERLQNAGQTPIFEEKVEQLKGTFPDLPSHFYKFNDLCGECKCLQKFIIADTPDDETDFIKRETVAYQLEMLGERVDRERFDPAARDRATYEARIFDPRKFEGRNYNGPTIRMWQEPRPVHPPRSPHVAAARYRRQQRYLDDSGINLADVTDEALGTVRLVDIEQGWNLAHEELRGLNVQSLRDDTPNDWRFHGHGSSVLGILAGAENGRGIAGIMPSNLDVAVVSEYWKYDKGQNLECYSTAEALIATLRSGFLKRGDILLIESQYWDEETDLLLPVEADPFTRHIIACLVKHSGIIVIEPAGNGGVDLDGIVRSDGSRFNVDSRSGAIVVAAATADDPHVPTFFTNRGRYVDCYAWGEEVTTCSDGETSRQNDDYIPDFTGTSAAAAIIAGVAALVQSIVRGMNPERSLTPDEMRQLLTNPKLGTMPAPGSAPIGVMPNVEKIVDYLKKRKTG